MSSSARNALSALLGGDPAPAEAHVRRAPDSAGAILLRAELARALPRVESPDVGELDAHLGAPADTRGLLVRAAYALALRDAVRLEGAWVSAWAERAGRLALGLDGIPELEASAVALWAAHFRGSFVGDDARALEVRAGRAGLADVVVELAALGALAALAHGDAEAARTIARRASRMARTEALPQAEYLAHLVLARVRRLDGQPHLATRIAAALATVAPPAFHGWLSLELALAGSIPAARALTASGDGPGKVAALGVLEAFEACASGRREEMDRALGAARSALTSIPSFATELGPLAVALDPARDLADAEPALRGFLLGHSDVPPGSLAGPVSLPRPGEIVGAVRVVATGSSTRRALGVGLALAGALAEIGREAGAPQRRRETMLAALALAGPGGSSKDELFRAVWGFAFVPHLHQGVLDVALHRLRPTLGDAAELVRTADDRLALRVLRPFAVTDPRVERVLDDRVLALVAARAGLRAREIADELDVPLRTVQAALARLEAEGTCIRSGEGPGTSYRVEDTTFREATRPR